MGRSPYSPVVPLVICLPLRPLTGALMARRRSEAFWLRIGLLPTAKIAHPTAPLLAFNISSAEALRASCVRLCNP